MDPAYYTAPAGSPEHYAAYEKEFEANHGLGFVFEDDPEASYEVDNAAELAYERWFEEYELAQDRLAEEAAPDIAEPDADPDPAPAAGAAADLEPELWF